MSVYAEQRGLSRRFRWLQLSFLQQDGLPFANALPEEQIERAFQEEDAMFAEDEGTIYTPHLTLWAFLSQVLHREEQRSCLAAVSRVIVLLVSLGWEACAKNSGAYCKARAKLPEPVLHRLVTDMARNCEDHVPEKWLWRGRHVTLCDGCTFSMPDTDENQAEYPQPDSQAPGLGFPMMRVVVLFSLATAMLQDLAMGPYSGKETGEIRSPRELSFTNALQTIAASLGTLAVVDAETAGRLIAAQLASFAEQRVGNRPNRVGPRAVKRRPKPHALLTMPREEARLLLLQGTDPYEKQK